MKLPNSFMRKIVEQDLIDYPNYWVKVSDTTKYPDGGTRRVHTRAYLLKLFGITWDIGFKFVYDYENPNATCRFDKLAEGALQHIKKGDFEEDKIKDKLFDNEPHAHYVVSEKHIGDSR
jgi:hypothetical protein